MKLLARKKENIYLLPGDTFSLNYDDGRQKREVLSHIATRDYHITEVAIWELEKGDDQFFGSDSGLIGGFLE